MAKDKHIEDFDLCPHCGDTFGYYQRYYVSGWIQDNRLFGTGERYNAGMYDSLSGSWHSKYWYCMKCGKRICKVSDG